MLFIMVRKVDETMMLEPQQELLYVLAASVLRSQRGWGYIPSQEHCPHRTDFHWEKVCRHPRRVANRNTIEEDEPDDEDEHGDRWRRDSGRFEIESLSIDGNEVEGYGDPADIPQTVQIRTRRRPRGSTVIMLTHVMIKLTPATTKPTATGLAKPTKANRVAE